MRPALLVAALLAAYSTSGCVFYPRTTAPVDPDCRMITRKLRLNMAVMQNVDCKGGDLQACFASIAAVGVVSASTAVVSGSIVVVNNTLSWLERKGRCGGKKPPPPAPGN